MKTPIYAFLMLSYVVCAEDTPSKVSPTKEQKALLVYKCELPPGFRQKVGHGNKVDFHDIYRSWHRQGWYTMMKRYSKHGDTKVEQEPLAMMVPQGFGPMYQAMIIGHSEAKAAIWKLEVVVGKKRAQDLATSAIKQNKANKMLR